jgi:hypothetical protein
VRIFRVTLRWSRRYRKDDPELGIENRSGPGYYMLFRGNKVSYAGQSRKTPQREALMKDKPASGVKFCRVASKSGSFTSRMRNAIERALVFHLQPGQNKTLKNHGPTEVSLTIRNAGSRRPLPKKLKWDAESMRFTR